MKYLPLFFAAAVILYFSSTWFAKSYEDREDRNEEPTTVLFTASESCTDTIQDSIAALQVSSLLDFGEMTRPYLPYCQYEIVNGKTFVLIGKTLNGIVAYFHYDRNGKGRFTRFSRLNTYNSGPYFRFGVTEQLSSRFRVDTTQPGQLFIHADVRTSSLVTDQGDLDFQRPTDTTFTEVTNCFRCIERKHVLDSILRFELRYIDDHTNAIDNVEARKRELSEKLLQ